LANDSDDYLEGAVSLIFVEVDWALRRVLDESIALVNLST